MMFMKKLFLFFLGFVSTTLAFAQTTAPLLTASEAVRIALENNFGIKISAANAEIARLNNTKGNAGMLPVVNFVAAENFTLSAFQQKLANGNEFNALGAPFNVANAGVQLSWTLFDGRRMNIAKKRLEEMEKMGQMSLQETVLNTTATVLLAYNELVRAQLQEQAINEIIALNMERLRIAEARLAAGFAAQTDALTAKIDLNQRKADLLNQENLTATGKRNLNLLLARPVDTPFEVENKLDNTYNPQRTSILEKIYSQNPTLLAARKNAEIAALQVDENRTLNKARIVGNSQFNAQRSDNGAGFLKNNTQIGFTVGASLVLPLYNGGNNKRLVETAQVAALQSRQQVDLQQQNIEAQLDNQLALFQTQQQVLKLEEENAKTARENLNISLERFRVGQTNSLEVQLAQNTLEMALNRRNLVLFNLKATELQLRTLASEL
jgi:outer membrane protein TolC